MSYTTLTVLATCIGVTFYSGLVLPAMGIVFGYAGFKMMDLALKFFEWAYKDDLHGR